MTKNKMLKVIVCRVGQAPVVEEIPSGLEAMQKIVGGYIECVRLEGTPFEHGIDLWCDEEFLLKDYKPNRMIGPELVIHGDFFIAAHDAEGETLGLTVKEIARLMPLVESWPVALNLPSYLATAIRQGF
jgi:hypothetical protein